MIFSINRAKHFLKNRKIENWTKLKKDKIEKGQNWKIGQKWKNEKLEKIEKLQKIQKMDKHGQKWKTEFWTLKWTKSTKLQMDKIERTK